MTSITFKRFHFVSFIFFFLGRGVSRVWAALESQKEMVALPAWLGVSCMQVKCGITLFAWVGFIVFLEKDKRS